MNGKVDLDKIRTKNLNNLKDSAFASLSKIDNIMKQRDENL